MSSILQYKSTLTILRPWHFLTEVIPDTCLWTPWQQANRNRAPPHLARGPAGSPSKWQQERSVTLHSLPTMPSACSVLSFIQTSHASPQVCVGTQEGCRETGKGPALGEQIPEWARSGSLQRARPPARAELTFKCYSHRENLVTWKPLRCTGELENSEDAFLSFCWIVTKQLYYL